MMSVRRLQTTRYGQYLNRHGGFEACPQGLDESPPNYPLKYPYGSVGPQAFDSRGKSIAVSARPQLESMDKKARRLALDNTTKGKRARLTGGREQSN